MIENFSKTLSRLAAVQILYALDVKNEITNEELNIESIIKDSQKYYQTLQKKNETAEKLNSKFLKRLVALVLKNLSDIDSMIELNLKKDIRRSTRINSLLKEILRSGICEILYFKTPSKVTIDEYAKLTKQFFDAEEIGFVNALLDRISKDNLNKPN